MFNKLYKATFKGIRKTAKSPSYNNKNACYRWLVANSNRIKGELILYEIDVAKARCGENMVAYANEYPNLCLDSEQNVSVQTFKEVETYAFHLGRQTLFGILNNTEDIKLGLA